MIVSINKLKERFSLDLPKLKNILSFQLTAPKEFKINTEHLSHLATLTPYVYYTSLVRQYLKSDSQILDWGAYLGQVSYLLQDDFDIKSYNLFPNPEITYWHQKLNIKNPIFGNDIDKYKYDAVISSGVLEHTFEFGETDIEALKKLYQILKPSGYLFIWNLPTTHALAEKIAMDKKSWKHILRYDLDDILVKLNLTGFDIVKIEHNELFFSKLAKIFKMIPITTLWQIDQYLCQLSIFAKYSHHFTIVAKKVDNFPASPASSGYTTYIS